MLGKEKQRARSASELIERKEANQLEKRKRSGLEKRKRNHWRRASDLAWKRQRNEWIVNRKSTYSNFILFFILLLFASKEVDFLLFWWNWKIKMVNFFQKKFSEKNCERVEKIKGLQLAWDGEIMVFVWNYCFE